MVFHGRRGRRIAVALALLCALFAAFAVHARFFASMDRGTAWSRAVFDRHGALINLPLAADERYRLKLPLADYPPELVEAVFFRRIGASTAMSG